jgi:hypothetical protein
VVVVRRVQIRAGEDISVVFDKVPLDFDPNRLIGIPESLVGQVETGVDDGDGDAAAGKPASCSLSSPIWLTWILDRP